eukprot:530543-Prorocentrum_minimum.AAC.6
MGIHDAQLGPFSWGGCTPHTWRCTIDRWSTRGDPHTDDGPLCTASLAHLLRDICPVVSLIEKLVAFVAKALVAADVHIHPRRRSDKPAQSSERGLPLIDVVHDPRTARRTATRSKTVAAT